MQAEVRRRVVLLPMSRFRESGCEELAWVPAAAVSEYGSIIQIGLKIGATSHDGRDSDHGRGGHDRDPSCAGVRIVRDRLPNSRCNTVLLRGGDQSNVRLHTADGSSIPHATYSGCLLDTNSRQPTQIPAPAVGGVHEQPVAVVVHQL